MDTLPARGDLGPDTYIDLAPPDVHLIGGSNPELPVLFNGGLLFVRNSGWAKDFLRLWWDLRGRPARESYPGSASRRVRPLDARRGRSSRRRGTL